MKGKYAAAAALVLALCPLVFADDDDGRPPFSAPPRWEHDESHYKGEHHEDPAPVIPYHGMRLPPVSPKMFCVEEIRARAEHDGDDDDDERDLEIYVRFSLPIDPRTLDRGKVLSDARGRAVRADFGFNRAGDVLKIELERHPRELDALSLTLTLTELKAFNGEAIEPRIFAGIGDGYTYRAKENPWKES